MKRQVSYANLVFTALFSLANCAPYVIPQVVSMEIVKDIKPVNMTLYYETLCPGCNDFVTTQVYPTWSKVKDLNIMTVNLLPFGNAKESKNGSKWDFNCQHGVEECTGNIAETCMLHYHTDTTQRVNMINCFQLQFYQSHDLKSSLQKCADTGFNVTQIEECVKGDEGNELEHIMAMNTGMHKWTPWVMLDGEESDYAMDHLLKAVCDKYKGPKPDVCKAALADE